VAIPDQISGLMPRDEQSTRRSGSRPNALPLIGVWMAVNSYDLGESSAPQARSPHSRSRSIRSTSISPAQPLLGRLCGLTMRYASGGGGFTPNERDS